MKTAFRSLGLSLLILAAGCSEKLPARFTAVPADADVVVTLDLPPLLAFSKEVLAQAVPADIKDQIPTLEQLARQVMQMAGVDLASISRITLIGYINSKDRMAIIAEGLSAAGLKGDKTSEHAGIAIHSIGHQMSYAELAGLGVAFAPNPQVLGQVVDAFAGKAKNIADGESGKLLRVLVKQESDLDVLRAYLTNGKLAAGNPQFSLKGGGFFLHLERGCSAVVVSDETSIARMKQALDLGMMAFQTSLAFGGAKENPMGLDPKVIQRLGELLRKVGSRQDGDRLIISFRGDLRPIIQEAAGYLLAAIKATQRTPLPESEDAAPTP